MISPQAFCHALSDHGISFITGVPDSLLKEFCAYIDAALPSEQHCIAVNEGTAVGLAAGVHLATGTTPLIYMQNSGLGNAVNPLMSLADPDVYSLPVILLIGWRGMPGVKDEPQHAKQGRVTPAMLDAMEIPYRELRGDAAEADEAVAWAAQAARNRSGPVALLVHKGAFGPAEKKRSSVSGQPEFLFRESAISLILEELKEGDSVVATTGQISREVYEQRALHGQTRHSDFLTVGSMGHASQIALGLAKAFPHKQIVCLDGDGAALMHMGGLATIGCASSGNLLHIVLNNGAHDSVGGQPTVAFRMSLVAVAKACGYTEVLEPVMDEIGLREALRYLTGKSGRLFLEVYVRKGARKDLGRPKESPVENKQRFMSHLHD